MEGSTQAPVMSGDDGKNNSGLMNTVEKGFSEAFLFTLSMVLHMTHSLEGEYDARS